ncbi:MAG TPA: metalloregulator ArsR/SmtB family transcription factor [Streptosporangiaceae bacterium]|nr:metalloregulator ArsR/SmtB family transcription factor [Streptosporangiaceae bacterium]
MVDGREAKDRLYEAFARTAKAVASPKRIELLELLAQGERTVDALAGVTGMGVTNTSAHLQILARARLVENRKEGTKVFYRLASDDVAAFVVVLRDLARSRLAEVEQVVRDYFGSRDALESISREELLIRAGKGKVVILDVRPTVEFVAGHIPGALSVPLGELDAALARLPKRTEIVAYCRGPYCVLAPQAVERLAAKGYRARRLVDGFPEWRLAGLPMAAGEE